MRLAVDAPSSFEIEDEDDRRGRFHYNRNGGSRGVCPPDRLGVEDLLQDFDQRLCRRAPLGWVEPTFLNEVNVGRNAADSLSF